MYTGEAVNPKNLSWFEGLMDVGRPYKKEVERRKSKEIEMRTHSQKVAFSGQVGQDGQANGAARVTCTPVQPAAQHSPQNPVWRDIPI